MAMAAAIGLPVPRLPQALARHQEAHPLVPTRKEPLPQVLGKVITLRAMCAKWWLERVQQYLRRDTSKPKLFALQRFLSDLPREIRSYIIHNGLKAGGLHLAHGSKEIPAVNRSLVFLSSDLKVHETIYLTIPKPNREGIDFPPDLELLFRNGEGIQKILISMPDVWNNHVKRALSDLCRTCQHLTNITVHNASDDALAVITRHCRDIQTLDVSGSPDVTDEGVSRAIVNLKWPDEGEVNIKMIDVGGTSVTLDGVMSLLSRLPSVLSFGSMDVVEAIEGIIALSENTSFKTSIEETTLKCATVNRIQTLRRHCPNLHSIKVTFQEHPGTYGASLNDLRLLGNLIHLDIIVREPFLLAPAHLHQLVWAIGPKLMTLKVSGDVYWEADLGSLVGQCPLIRNLALPAITLPMKESLSVLTAVDSPVLSKLTELQIDCMTGVGPKAWAKDFTLVRRGIVLALRRCTLLRKLVLRPTCLVDMDFMDILSYNRLERLEVLELYNSTLGLSFAKVLIDTCVNLHVMKGLRTWRGMTLHDLVLLRKHSRGHRRAADLKIVP